MIGAYTTSDAVRLFQARMARTRKPAHAMRLLAWHMKQSLPTWQHYRKPWAIAGLNVKDHHRVIQVRKPRKNIWLIANGPV